MKIDLVKAVEEDRKYPLQLRKSTMTEHLAAAGIFLSDAEHDFRVDDAFDCTFIAWHSGARIGMAKSRNSNDRLEIMQLQVLPEYQGKGLGQELVQSFIDTAKAENKCLMLAVLKRNPAKRLYERLGFSVVGEDEHEFHMRLEPG